MLGKKDCPLCVMHAIIGQMVDLGVKDANNMGAAMMPDNVNLDPYIFRHAKHYVLHKNHDFWHDKSSNISKTPITESKFRSIIGVF